MPPKRIKTRPAEALPKQKKQEAEQEPLSELQQPKTPTKRPREGQDQAGKAGAAQKEPDRTRQQDSSRTQQQPGSTFTATSKTKDRS
jgi:hypothetical protein